MNLIRKTCYVIVKVRPTLKSMVVGIPVPLVHTEMIVNISHKSGE